MPRVFRRRPILAAVLALLVMAGVAFGVLTSVYGERFLKRIFVTRQELWFVVTWVCRPSAAIGLGLPCRDVVPARGDAPGYYVLKTDRAHVLTIPATPIVGIEDPAALRPEAAAYWQAAWESRRILDEWTGVRLDRTAVGIAVNSRPGRSQDQLHMHTSCIRPQLVELIRAEGASFDTTWRMTKGAVWGVSYQARRISGADLAGQNLFALLPEDAKASPDRMRDRTLVAVGARFADGTEGFYLFTDYVHGWDDAAGEDLLDHRCQVAADPAMRVK